MAGERDIHVLVPDRSGEALLVAGGKLPCVRGGQGAAGAIEALRLAFGLDAPYLRPAAFVGWGPDRHPDAALHEFDAPPAGFEPPASLAWLRLEDADAHALALPELTPHIEHWLALAGGAPVPEERAPWARSGWFAEASAWLEKTVAREGLGAAGPVEVVEQWPLSSLLRCETDGGRVYLKAAFSIFRHEPALTRALAAQYPALVPDVPAVDLPRGWMLMRELPGTQMGDGDVERWSDAVRAMARIHRGWATRHHELLALDSQDRALATLASEIRAAFDDAGVAADERIVSELERRCDELARGPLPQTLVHGDFHPWNVMVDGDDLRIFDWSDACVSHPFFDLPTLLERAPDVEARESVLRAYLACWEDAGSLEELRALYDFALPIAHVHHAISYLRIGAAFEAGDRWWFADEPSRRLSAAIELLETS